MAFCRSCGNGVDDAARFCQHCGSPQTATTGTAATTAAHTHLKDPAIAVLLSFLWSGAGQVYAGAISRGIWRIVIGSFLFLWGLGTAGAGFIFAIPFWIWAMFDARAQAIKQNDLAR